MKPLLLLLVLVNLGYLLMQQMSDDSSTTATSAVAKAEVAEAMGFVELAPGVSSAGLGADSLSAADSPSAAGANQIASGSNLVVPEVVAVPVSCVVAGPFRRQRDADALVKQLAKAGVQARRQPRDLGLLPDYMVYVGPEASNRDARALAARFKARKMDAHVIGSGELQNALSLGVFSRGPLAQSLYQQLKSEGFAASIATMTRNRRGYQVRAELPQLIRARLVEADTPMVDCPAGPDTPAAPPNRVASAS